MFNFNYQTEQHSKKTSQKSLKVDLLPISHKLSSENLKQHYLPKALYSSKNLQDPTTQASDNNKTNQPLEIHSKQLINKAKGFHRKKVGSLTNQNRVNLDLVFREKHQKKNALIDTQAKIERQKKKREIELEYKLPGLQEMIYNYQNLPFYEKLRIDINGMAPPQEIQEESIFIPSQQYLNNTRSMPLIQNNQQFQSKNKYLIKQKEYQSLLTKEYPHKKYDDSALFVTSSISQASLNSTVAPSFRKRFSRLQKDSLQLKDQLNIIFKKYDDTSKLENQEMIKKESQILIKGFLEKYFTRQEVQTLDQGQIESLFNFIVNQSSNNQIDNCQQFTDIIQGIVHKSPLVIQNRTQSHLNLYNQRSSRALTNATHSRNVMASPLQFNSQMLSTNQFDKGKNNNNAYLELYKTQDLSNQIFTILTKISDQNSASKQKAINDYLVQKQDQINFQDEASEQTINKLSKSQSLSMINIPNQKHSTHQKRKIIKQQEKVFGKIVRNKLLLEHVMLERKLKMQQDTSETDSKKKLTCNIENSEKKRELDVDYFRLQKSLRPKKPTAGYTGHVPYRYAKVGITIGNANKICQAEAEFNSSMEAVRSSQSPSRITRLCPDIPRPETVKGAKVLQYQAQKKLLASNNSKNAKSWLGGPKHEIQDIQLPGYTGYIPSVNSENFFGRSYSVSAAKSKEGKIKKGLNQDKKEIFVSQNHKDFNPKMIRFKNSQHKANNNSLDYIDYLSQLNKQQGERTRNLYISQSTMGNRSNLSNFRPSQINMDSSFTTIPKEQLNKSTVGLMSNVQIKSRLIETGFADEQKYQNLGDGFKRIFLKDEAKDIRLPVVGYTGHIKGVKSNGVNAKNFRVAAIKSRMIERILSNQKSQYIKS